MIADEAIRLVEFIREHEEDRYDYLHSYFMRIPKEERDNVRYVCSVMYDCYRSIARACFTNSMCIVDHFHLSQELGRRIDSVRIRTMKKYSGNRKSCRTSH